MVRAELRDKRFQSVDPSRSDDDVEAGVDELARGGGTDPEDAPVTTAVRVMVRS